MPDGKKNPKYLEEMTFAEESLPWDKGREMFSHSDLFLGRYTEHDIWELMEKVGLLDLIGKKGYDNLIISISKQNFTSRLYVNYERLDKDTRLVELILREGMFRPNRTFIERFDFSAGLSMILVEWLALQNPRARFSPERPKLPGQAYPGLGGLRNLQQMLYLFGDAGRKDAIVDVPQHYHAAVIYSRLYSSIYSRLYAFFSPIDAGLVEAMIRDLSDRPLAPVSLAISSGCLVNEVSGAHETWRASEQVYPITKLLQEYVESREYKAIVEETAAKVKYAIDWYKYNQLFQQGIRDEA